MKKSKFIKLVSEKKYDVPLKTQVEQHVLVEEGSTEKECESMLLERYHEILQRGTYTHSKIPTNIYIYLYDCEEKATADLGLWVAMLSYCFWLSKHPVITYSSSEKRAVQASIREIREVFNSIRAFNNSAGISFSWFFCTASRWLIISNAFRLIRNDS